jgi:vacuolar-type H+-ATPase subunit H
MTEETNETQQFEYQQPPATSEADIQVKKAEQSPVSSQEEMINARERKAFEIYIQNQGMEIPKNFKDAGAYFDSLKNAQKEYTKARQEIATLKKTYEQDGSVNPSYEEPSVQSEEPVVEQPKVNIPEELRIPELKKEETKTSEPVKPVILEEDWSKWSMEVAISNNLSEETVNEIKSKTGFSDRMITDYVEGQRARSREAFGKAAEIVGSKDQLSSIFAWAAKTMTPAQQAEINATLASPSWEVALLGLQAKYERATAGSAKGKEMPKNKQVNVAATKAPLQPYKTKREFYADRGNPRYNSDPKFRQAVEQRMVMTDITRLPN